MSTPPASDADALFQEADTRFAQFRLRVQGMNSPIALCDPGTGNVMFVLDQIGRIYAWTQDGQAPQLVYDQSTLFTLLPNYDERGYLNLVAHPLFAQNRLVYLYYATTTSTIAGMNHDNVLEELEWIPSSGHFQIRRRLMQLSHPQMNHSGGAMCFVPMRLSASDVHHILLLSVGDGGGAGDQEQGHTPVIGNAQDDNSPLGKIWAIRVDERTPLFRMVVKGNRNVWRMSYEPSQEAVWFGNAGQEEYESIYRIGVVNLFSPQPLNLGWRAYETFPHVYDQALATRLQQADTPIVLPHLNYAHSALGGQGIAVVAGYLTNRSGDAYVFGDFTGHADYDPIFYTPLTRSALPPVVFRQPRTPHMC